MRRSVETSDLLKVNREGYVPGYQYKMDLCMVTYGPLRISEIKRCLFNPAYCHTLANYSRQVAEYLWIGHFRVAFYLCVKTSLYAKPIMWKCVSPTGSFSYKSNFYEKGFALGLVMKQRHNVTQKWPISSMIVSIWRLPKQSPVVVFTMIVNKFSCLSFGSSGQNCASPKEWR